MPGVLRGQSRVDRRRNVGSGSIHRRSQLGTMPRTRPNVSTPPAPNRATQSTTPPLLSRNRFNPINRKLIVGVRLRAHRVEKP